MKRNIYLLISCLIIVISCKRNEEIGYYDSGNLSFRIPLKDGKRHGLMQSFYRNGQIKGEVSYVNGDLKGTAFGYDSLGNKISIIEYDKNKKEGEFTLFYQSGKLKMKGLNCAGIQCGKAYEYYENGNIFRKFYFDEGKPIYVKTYSKENELVASTLPIKVTPLSENKIKITLLYSEHDSVRLGLIIGPMDAQWNFIGENHDVYASDSLSILYEVKPNEERITGKVFEVKMPGNKIDGEYHFEYKIE